MGGVTASTRPLFLRPGPLALVVAGGAVGTFARALLEDAFPAQPAGWPWATFAINVAGSFLLGVLLTVLASRGPDEGRLRLARITLGTGVMGGFTTYSTFIVEVDERLRGGHEALGAGYAVVSVLLGIVAALAGVVLAGARRPRVVDPDAPNDLGEAP